MSAPLVLALAITLQGGWTVAPSSATVGDTVRLTRVIAAPAGWGVRATRLAATADVEPLSDPAVERAAAGWRLQYAVVAWTPGEHRVLLPPVWLVGPAGRADSLPGDAVRLTIASVLPASDGGKPKPALAPLRTGRRMAWPVLAAAGAAVVLLVVGWRWRRRPPRDVPLVERASAPAAVPDGRWLAAGEPRAVVARARALLRATLARAVPEAHEALGTAECVAVATRVRPDFVKLKLEDTLQALDVADFGADPGPTVAALAARARALALELGA